MHPVAAYLSHVSVIRRSGAGTSELSYYPALSNLLDAVGRELKPRVRCIMNPSNRGAGLPDGGLFTPDQFARGEDPEFSPDLTPSRGVLEVKSADAVADRIADGKQVDRYFSHYRQVLVCNLWEFILVGRDANGAKAKLERFRLADSETEFWARAAHPEAAAKELGDGLLEYLRRVMLSTTSLVDPKEVAWLLASYARDARARVEAKGDLPKLAAVREGLGEALGMSFSGEKGDHFFRSTLVQTLFYGVFASWVIWARDLKPDDRYSRFDWKNASWTLHVPMMRALFHQVAAPDQLMPLGLVEVLDWTAQALNRVDRTEFFARFVDAHAVQYFYEPFLQEFDPELRKELGVWYTPPEVVAYMVERVDRVLRTELGVADGLADPRVYVLDPCCGTGAYLVEVLRRIHRTVQDRDGAALAAQDVKRAVMDRVFGFEILPAPYAVAHMQLGLFLHGLGVSLSDSKERAGVYLTNALTGWEPPRGEKQRLLFPELEEERDAAERVKREAPILVVLGNPPYNAFAGVSPAEEQGLVELYKEGLSRDWKIKKFNLDDLYIRFFRLAERRIAEMGERRGVVSFISNFSYLSDPSFVVMRRRFLEGFDSLWFDCLNGDSRQTGKLTPEGEPDPSIFSTEYNREGIQVGTAVGLLVKRGRESVTPRVRYRQFWGANKRQALLASLGDPELGTGYSDSNPRPENRYNFRPQDVGAEYRRWPLIVDLSGMLPVSGLQEMRRFSLIDISKEELTKRMQLYFSRTIDWDKLVSLNHGYTIKAGGFEPKLCREKLLRVESYSDEKIVKYNMLPFDVRYAYLTTTPPLWNRSRPELVELNTKENAFIVTRLKTRRPNEFIPLFFTRILPDYHFFDPNVVAIPLLRKRPEECGDLPLFSGHGDRGLVPNLSPGALAYLEDLYGEELRLESASDGLWMHTLVIGFSPAYLTENADGVRGDWPRIPLPADRGVLEASASLGRLVASLLDTEAPVEGVTAGSVDPFLRLVGVLSAKDGGVLDPNSGDMDVTVGWGHAGKNGVTMPGRGRLVKRSYTEEERDAMVFEALSRELEPDEAMALLGSETYDVYLNDRAMIRNVPEKVWEYFIGGYQVLKKWLSYRERDLLGRGLLPEEARHLSHTARRLAALRFLEPELDANYRAVVAVAIDGLPRV